MATERQLKDRMNGTANIHKITKSMKMVSAAKLRGDQNRLTAATPFGVSRLFLCFSHRIARYLTLSTMIVIGILVLGC
jgi:hypothetical protein